MTTPDQLEREVTLLTAVARYDELRLRDSLATASDEFAQEEPASARSTPDALSKDEALQLLALGEVIIRKAGYGRQIAVRSARAAGASWTEIGAATGTSKQAAWQAHNHWIEGLAQAHRRNPYLGLDDAEVEAARRLANDPDETIT